MINRKLDEFTQAYIECALWSSNDGDDDRSLGAGDSGSTDRNCRFMTIDDIADETLEKMVADCSDFQSKFWEYI
jgi:dihydroxyacetone kinase